MLLLHAECHGKNKEKWPECGGNDELILAEEAQDKMRSSFTITSLDTLPVVQDRLAAALTTVGPSLFGPTTFRGGVSDGGFRVIRNYGWGPVMPIIATGKFSATSGGTVIQVNTRIQWWVVLGLCAWSSFWVRHLWERLVSDPHPSGIHWGEIAAVVAMGVFAWLMAFAGFTNEERIYQQSLTQIIAPAKPPHSL